jgi:hypothetical protein
MFLAKDRLVLIDFEELVEIATDPVRAAECLLWHEVFFADCLDTSTAAALFDHEPLAVPDGTLVMPDAFEQALLGEEMITFATRRDLLRASARLEGRHRRPDGTTLFGHELGHFWGDFIPPTVEVTIFRHLTAIDDPDALAGCLELFEAAMEADIIRMMRQRAVGDTEVTTPRTHALASNLGDAGWQRLYEVRQATPDWYDALWYDPGELIDRSLFRVGATFDEAIATTCMVGTADSRSVVERALRRTMSVGLAFMHREDPLLRYAAPDGLQDMIASALPHDGDDFDAVLQAADRLVVAHSISQSHPGYLAFPDSANSLAAIAGSVLGRFLNQNLIAVDRSAPAATFVEIQVIEWLRELVGYDTKPLGQLRGVKDVGGLWTTGGHLSNHVAMLAVMAAATWHRSGLNQSDRPRTAVLMSFVERWIKPMSAPTDGLEEPIPRRLRALLGLETAVETINGYRSDRYPVESRCYIRTGVSIPSTSRPCLMMRPVRSHSASRLARRSSGALSTGQFS